jgi:purine nucleoside permease
MIQISPHALGDLGKRILNNISKYIVDKQQTNEFDDEENMSSSFFHGNFTLLADEPHSDPEIGADTRVKVIERYLFFQANFHFFSNSVN